MCCKPVKFIKRDCTILLSIEVLCQMTTLENTIRESVNCKAFINGINMSFSNFFIITSPKITVLPSWWYRYFIFSKNMAGWSSLVARLAHNQEVVCSNHTLRNSFVCFCKTDLRCLAHRQ